MVSQRGAHLAFRDCSDASGYKVCGVMTMIKLLELSEALVEPTVVHEIDEEEGKRQQEQERSEKQDSRQQCQVRLTKAVN